MEAQVTVRYLRRVQVAQFEPAEAEASLTTTVQDCTPERVAAMLADIKRAVLSVHGVDTVSPTPAASAPAPAAPAADKADRTARPAGRGRKTNQVTPTEEAEATVEPVTVHEVVPAEPLVDLEAFQAEVLRLASAHGATGAEVVRAVRAEYGVTRVRDIPEDRRAEFIAAVKARLG